MAATTPEERLRTALELAAVGEQMVRMRLTRDHPDWDEDRIQSAMEHWMQDRPGAPYGDHPGSPSSRVLGKALQ